MNVAWPEQEVFCLRVREYAELKGYLTARGGLDIPRLAQALDVAENTLKQFLRNKSRPRPHFDTLNGIAGVIGGNVTEFIGAERGGDPQVDPAFGNIMGILGKNLSPETKAAMIEMAKAAQQRGREREATEKPYMLDPAAGSGGMIAAEPAMKPRKK